MEELMVWADEGRDRRKQEEGKIALFSALQLLFSYIITLHPPDSENQGNPSSLETRVTFKLMLRVRQLVTPTHRLFEVYLEFQCPELD